MARRHYTNTAQPTTLTAGVSNSVGDTSLTVVSAASFPTPPFTIAVDRGTSDEEACLVSGVSSNTFTVTRAYNGTTAKSHLVGASVEHTLVALDLDEANAHIEDTGRDDHPQYINASRLSAYIPKTVSNATISAIATITGAPQTHALLTVPTATYARKVQVSGAIPMLFVSGGVTYEGRILQGSSDVVSKARSFGAEQAGIFMQTEWITLAANTSAQFRFQISRSSGSGGATEANADYNKFTALILRDA